MPETGPEFVEEGPGSRGPVSWRLWWTELVSTLLLGLAAVGAGWAAYQAAVWSSDQTFILHEANEAHRKAALLQNRAYLLRVVDVGLFTTYAQAISQNNTILADFIFNRFPPVMKAAITAWLATKPLKNPNAPPTPFAMREYRLPEEEESRRIDTEADQMFREAHIANKTSDRYVFMTVFFALVSLFCGLSSKFWSSGIRMGINGMAFVIFVVAVAVLISMPVR